MAGTTIRPSGWRFSLKVLAMADPKQSGGASPQTSDIMEGVTSVASKVADVAQEKARGLAATAEERARALAEEKKREIAEQAASGTSRPRSREYPSDVSSEGPGAPVQGASPLSADRSSPYGR